MGHTPPLEPGARRFPYLPVLVLACVADLCLLVLLVPDLNLDYPFAAGDSWAAPPPARSRPHLAPRVAGALADGG